MHVELKKLPTMLKIILSQIIAHDTLLIYPSLASGLGHEPPLKQGVQFLSPSIRFADAAFVGMNMAWQLACLEGRASDDFDQHLFGN